MSKLSYTGMSNGVRALKDGRYTCMIREVKTGIAKAGKYQGCSNVQWRLSIEGGELDKMECIAETLTTPPTMAWTTERIINAAFPAITAGQEVDTDELVGCLIEADIKTRINPKNNQTSMYVNIDNPTPYVAPFETGSLGAVGPSDVPSSFAQEP